MRTMSTAVASPSPPPSPSVSIAQRSTWHSPVPYLFGGLAAMLVLVAVALLILACSYWKFSGQEDNEGDIENGNNGKQDSGKVVMVYDEKILVIMAGDENPSFLATPVGCKSSEFGESDTKNEKADDEKIDDG